MRRINNHNSVALANARQAMIASGPFGDPTHKDVIRVRGWFGRAVDHELLPADVHQTLRRMKGFE